jgi:hypothetical protein
MNGPSEIMKKEAKFPFKKEFNFFTISHAV